VARSPSDPAGLRGSGLVRTAISIGNATSGGVADWPDKVLYAVESERLGVDYCWSAEGWGQDAVAPLAFVAARTNRMSLGTGIMQISARSASMTAMTALTMAAISNGRFVLGLGTSGPQVVEGLHGVPFDHPMRRLRECVEILKLAFSGQPISYDGNEYHLPLPGRDRQALRLAQRIQHPIPIYLAALSPGTLELAGEVADGWLGTCFIPEASTIFTDALQRGASRAGRDIVKIDLQAGGPIMIGDDLQAAIDHLKKDLAWRLGAHGAPEKNFYNNVYRRAGFVEEAIQIQRLWSSGDRDNAVAAVTDEMALSPSFVGTRDMVRGRIRAFMDAGVTTLRLGPMGSTVNERLEQLAKFLELLREVEIEAVPGRSQAGR
jgi:F420-dependent oxidoreductase-like protein